MERQRCTHCRNPIRTGQAVRRSENLDESWYHSDCWRLVQSSEQLNYEREIAASGLVALIAPYGVAGSRSPAGTGAGDARPSDGPRLEPVTSDGLTARLA